MKILDTVNRDLTEAIRKQDRERLKPLRMLKAALVNKRVEAGHALTEFESQQVVASMVKQRKDSIEQFSNSGRADLVQQETEETQVLRAYLPPPVNPVEIEQLVDAAIIETDATSTKDLGRIMKAVMPKLTGRNVDGKTVNELVLRKLAD